MLGFFDGDDVPDVFAVFLHGVFPDTISAERVLLSGRDGSVLWRGEAGDFAMAGDVAVDLDGDGMDEVIFNANTINDPLVAPADQQQLYLLDSAGRQARPWGMPLGAVAAGSPWVGDLDADGCLDLVVPRHSSDPGTNDGLLTRFRVAAPVPARHSLGRLLRNPVRLHPEPSSHDAEPVGCTGDRTSPTRLPGSGVVSQDPLHRLGEGLHAVRLAEPGEALLDRQLRALGRRVTAHDDDLLRREQTLDLFDDLQTIEHLAQQHVHDDQVERALTRGSRAAEELVGAQAALHDLDLVSEANEHTSSGAQLNRFVVDDEDARVSPRRGQHRFPALQAIDEGEVQGDGGSHSRRAGDVDESLVFLDDAVNDGESQTGPRGLLRALLGEEGLEDLAELVRLDAAAVVGDGQRRVATGRNDLVARPRLEDVDLGALDDDLAIPGDGLDRVANQVVDGPRQLRLRASDDERSPG